ncbi:MAG TPA: hypothetical protein VFW00_12165, partial [Rhodocyclaceae bacterium]|nr:hypothetical protein [Rhodocyclaceae bacterium]
MQFQVLNKFVSIKCQLINRRQLVGVLVTVLLAVPALAQPLPLFDQIRANYVASDALLLDRHGEPLADMRLDPKVRRLDWVSLTALPPAMREALLAAEDKRF